MGMMQVAVPPGMGAGMTMQVNTPQGMMEVAIPPGIKEGMMFEFMVPDAPMAMAQQVPMAPMAAAQMPVVAPVQPVAPAVVVQMPPQPSPVHHSGIPLSYMGAWKNYPGGNNPWQAGGGCDCCSDCCACCYGCWCPCCMLCDVSQMLRMGPNGPNYPDAAMFECPGQCLSFLTTIGPYGSGYCIGMCICPEYVGAGCYTTSLIKMTMSKYDLAYPSPCGSSECICGPLCLCSGFWCPCLMSCLIYRELKMREKPAV